MKVSLFLITAVAMEFASGEYYNPRRLRATERNLSMKASGSAKADKPEGSKDTDG